MEILERAEKFVDWLAANKPWANEHDLAFCAAMNLVHGFSLSDGDAFAIMRSRLNERWTDRELNHKIRQARNATSDKAAGYLLNQDRDDPVSTRRDSTPEPKKDRSNKRPAFEPSALQKMMCRGFSPSFAWLAERSPWDPRRVTTPMFLDAIFQPGEKTVLFFNYASQGQMGHIAGSPGRTCYVSDRPGARPVGIAAEDFPISGHQGGWFLPNPLDGKWHPNGKVDNAGNPELSRRTGQSIVTYRHLLLESDNAREEDWLNLICQLSLPITAMYTSGGRSIHALVKIDTPSKSAFDAFRDRASPILSKLGADPAAISGVRLTRLPGILRNGTMDKDGRYHKFDPPRLQRLLYLNPTPEVAPIKLMPRLRSIPAE